MACNDPRCELLGGGNWYCRECGQMTHAECDCSCHRLTCPECGHVFSDDEED